jgi:hypothetical protein
MNYKNTKYYLNNKEFLFNFSAENVSSDGGLLLLEQLEKKYGIIKDFSKLFEDKRHPSYIEHSVCNILKQRIFLIMQGYEDANDIKYLEKDPVLNSVLSDSLASQPTVSRLENSVDVNTIISMSNWFMDEYVRSIPMNKNQIIIDVDATDDPTHGHQQYTLYNGYYQEMMYSELLFHDGETGQVILPVLRPGNAHSNKWFVPILKRLVEKIYKSHPDIEIIIRADGGFSGAKFYNLANQLNLKFCVGIPANEKLKKKTEMSVNYIQKQYVEQNIKFKLFVPAFDYKANKWEKSEKCYAKIESTGKGINVRYFCSNMDGQIADELYNNFYVMRGEASENRIKEIKNMCFSDRLSCTSFTANYVRLFLSTLAYELFRKLKELIKITGDKEASRWLINNLRLFVLKIGTIIKIKKRRITVSFTKHYKCKELLVNIFALC